MNLKVFRLVFVASVLHVLTFGTNAHAGLPAWCRVGSATIAREEKPFKLRGEPAQLNTSEAKLGEQMAAVRETFDKGVAGTFTGFKDIPIAYRKWEVPNEKGAIVIFQGFASHMREWQETIHNLVGQGYSVYIMDPRGQGESGRNFPSKPKMMHVDDFDEYSADSKIFVDSVVKKTPHKRTLGLMNSMGAAYGLAYARKHPETFEKIALVAPMVGLRPAGLPPVVGSMLGTVARILGRGRSYGFGQSDTNRDPTTFEDQHSTHSRTRYDLFDKGLFGEVPELAKGGASFRWVERAIQQNRENQRYAHTIKAPLLIIQAGGEGTVDNASQDMFARRAPNAQILRIPGAGHWLLGEKDEMREPTMQAIFDFYEPSNQ